MDVQGGGVVVGDGGSGQGCRGGEADRVTAVGETCSRDSVTQGDGEEPKGSEPSAWDRLTVLELLQNPEVEKMKNTGHVIRQIVLISSDTNRTVSKVSNQIKTGVSVHKPGRECVQSVWSLPAATDSSLPGPGSGLYGL